MRTALLATALATVTTGILAEQSPAVSLEALLDAYAAGEFNVIARSLDSEETFERIREELHKTSAQWVAARPRPLMAVFMLDLALAAHNRQWERWLDIICTGRQFLTTLPVVPGLPTEGSCSHPEQIKPRPITNNPAEHAFEIAWHKASIALLEGLRNPKELAEQGVEPLRDRMWPEQHPDGQPRLIDPWIVLHRGFVQEQHAIVEPRELREHAANALFEYEQAVRYPPVRQEALVRAAWLRLRQQEPEAALSTLDQLDPAFDDPAVEYWSHLFRGRTLVALGRSGEAAEAYQRARTRIPGAQAPLVGLMALELGRGRREAAYDWAALVRRPADPEANDPWWDYWSGDFRFFAARLRALREMVR